MTISDTEVDVDNTTSGLNFVTSRPRTAILRDQAQVLRTVYDPVHYYDRVLRTALQLAPHVRYRASVVGTLKMAWTFCKVSVKAGFNRRTGSLYWKTLLTVLVTNNEQLSSVALDGLVHYHPEDRVGFIKIGADRQDHVGLFNLREGSG